MSGSTYRTAQGKMVDMNALRLKNEHVRAVGNMGVNAKGDVVDGRGRTVSTRNKQVAKQYQRQVSGPQTNVTHQHPPSSMEEVKARAHQVAETAETKKPKRPKAEKSQAPKFEPDEVNNEIAAVPEGTNTGLAAAIARARELRKSSNTHTNPETRPGIIKI